MKISKREKILLIILGTIIILGSYYKYIFLYQRDKLAKLQEEKKQCSIKVEEIKNHKTLIKQRKFDIKVLKSKITNKTSILYPKIQQENIIVHLNEILNNSGLRAPSLAFTDIEVGAIEYKSKNINKNIKNPLKDLADEYNGVKREKEKEKITNNSNSKEKLNGENMSVSMNFKGSYSDVISFIKVLESFTKRIVIENIKLSQEGLGNVRGSAVLQFYAVPKIGDEDKDFLNWDIKNTYGKDNPFDGGALNIINTGTIEEIGEKREKDFDFLATVRSINSDLPTVMLGKSKDSGKTTYVYGDNAEIENVEIHLTKKDGKYYYKYKTSRDKYPSDYAGDGEEFIPITSDNIKFKIYSNKRSSKEDLSGASIKIYNRTDKEVDILVEDDDNIKPRVVIFSEGSIVNVKRN